MNGDKAPGLDGFTIAFFHSRCNMIRGDVMKYLKQFYSHSSFGKKSMPRLSH